MKYLFLLLAAAGCDDTVAAPPPFIHGPSDSVLAGPVANGGPGANYPRYMFVSGQERNLVYVVDLPTANNNPLQVLFVTAPNQYFPLEIPVDKTPTAIAATPDDAFVLVLCADDQKIEVIDANTLERVRDATGTPVSVPVGIGGQRLLYTNSDTAGAHFVSVNSGDQTLTLLHVVETSTTDKSAAGSFPVFSFGSIAVDATIQLGVNISRGTYNATTSTLYLADPTSTFVHAVALPSGAVTDFDLGYAAVDVLYDNVTNQIFAATPETSGITVLRADNGQIVATNPLYAPLQPDEPPYTGIYLGEIPRRMLIADVSGTPLTIYCTGGNDSTTTVARYLAVATDTGPVYFIDLLTDQVISTSGLQCETPSVGPTTVPDPLGLFTTFAPFLPCDNTVASRYCAINGTVNTGVIAYPGHTDSGQAEEGYRIQLQWEAVVPGADRSTGGGTLGTDGQTISDIGVNLQSLAIQAGDIVVFVSPPADDPASCQQTYGDTTTTAQREFTIQSINPNGSITLAQTVDTTCFSTRQGELAYQIRVGNGFLLSGGPTLSTLAVLGRVGPGQTYGGDNLELIRFTVRPDIAQQPQVTRDAILDFTALDYYVPLRGSTIGDQVTGDVVPAGHVPTAMTIAESGTGDNLQYRLFVSYGGTDTIAAFWAFDSGYISTPDDTALLQ